MAVVPVPSVRTWLVINGVESATLLVVVYQEIPQILVAGGKCTDVTTGGVLHEGGWRLQSTFGPMLSVAVVLAFAFLAISSPIATLRFSYFLTLVASSPCSSGGGAWAGVVFVSGAAM